MNVSWCGDLSKINLLIILHTYEMQIANSELQCSETSHSLSLPNYKHVNNNKNTLNEHLNCRKIKRKKKLSNR